MKNLSRSLSLLSALALAFTFACSNSPEVSGGGSGDGDGDGDTGGDSGDGDGDLMIGDGDGDGTGGGVQGDGDGDAVIDGCSDGNEDDGEECDDGNLDDGDGCDSDCQIEENEIFECPVFGAACEECGNGTKESTEGCDDGNTDSGDGCSPGCDVEADWICNPVGDLCNQCGNGTVEGEEQCDDGNTSGDPIDGCSANCRETDPFYSCPEGEVCTLCGDGILDAGEACDDGNNYSLDGCLFDCSDIEDGFTCEDGQLQCQMCGNGRIEGTETCDDGNSEAGDGCDASCAGETGYICAVPGSACYECGNGVQEGSATSPGGYEQCDDGGQCSVTTTTRCTSDVDCPSGEACGPAGSDGCSASCQLENSPGTPWSCPVPGQPCVSCGNGTIDGEPTDLIHEECDDGNNDGDDGCNEFCQLESGASCPGANQPCTVCGDGQLDAGAGEQCDDDNRFERDGCNKNCQIETNKPWDCSLVGQPCALCGNGIKEPAEVCDDGNSTNNDGCTTACEVTDASWYCEVLPGQFRSTCDRCGNGLIKLAGTASEEECDDGNTNPADGCDATCNITTGYSCPGPGQLCNDCGNGTVEGTEKCDEGDGNVTAGCNSCMSVTQYWTCTTPGTSCTQCGDGAVQSPQEKCDDGGNANGDGCRADCKSIEAGWICPGGVDCTQCGNGQINGTEECDDGNTNPNDGCASCQVDDTSGWTCYPADATKPLGRSECDLCGNNRVRGDEQCDDGNTAGSDGCSGQCDIETDENWTCPAAGGACNWCGSGVLEAKEKCDEGEGNVTAGCVSCTTITPNWYCTPGQSCTLCGNDIVEGNEVCDDDDSAACAADCKSINPGWICTGGNDCTQCGNGSVDAGEQCDDGNSSGNPVDGCDETCQWDDGDGVTGPYFCVTPGLPCLLCGNGVKEQGEECDDGNLDFSPADGCDSVCDLDDGWTCPIPGVECNSCGDGIYQGTEQCDDGNAIAGDGCLNCQLEPGWACEENGGCVSNGCGDGFVAGNEECDDGNRLSIDGCSALCVVEDGYVCPPAGGPCESTFCGDGEVNGTEQCDNGGQCSTTPQSCSADDDCPGVETCEHLADGTCDVACLEIGDCGDGIVGSGEECDDGGTCSGGTDDGNGCVQDSDCDSNACLSPTENAGANNGDGCDSLCDWEDTTLACSGKTDGKYNCVADTGCGDGVRGHDEACDDGNFTNNDGCTSCVVDPLYTCYGDVTETSDCTKSLGWVMIRQFDVNNVNPEALHYDPRTRSFVGYKSSEAQEPVELCIDGSVILHPDPGTDPSVTGEICPPGSPLGSAGCSVLTTADPVARYYAFDAGGMTGATYDPGSGSWYFLDSSGLTRVCDLPQWQDGLVSGADKVALLGTGIAIGDDGRLYVASHSDQAIHVYARDTSVTDCSVAFDIASGPVETYPHVTKATFDGIFALGGLGMLGTFVGDTTAQDQFFRFFQFDGTLVDSVEETDTTVITDAAGNALPAITNGITGAETATDGSGFIMCFNSNSEDCKLFGTACETDLDCERSNPGTVCRTEDDLGNPIAAPYCWAPAKARNDYSAANTADTDVPVDVLANDTFAQSVCRGGNDSLVPDPTSTYGGTITVGTGPTECGDASFGADDECLLYTPPADGTCNIIDTFDYGSFLGGDEEMFATVYVTVSCDCGNGVVDAGEDCDPVLTPATCDASCNEISICGNGIQEGSEACDSTDRDVCTWDCKIAGCGDGTRGGSEACDDGNNTPGDGCSATCQVEECGNDIVDPGEECDGTSDCALDCTFEPFCGDGIPEDGEACDDGNADNTDGCRDDCSIPVCGDGDIYPTLDPGEECDDGDNISGDGCTWNCLTEACGDGVLHVGEDCDEGPTSTSTCRGSGNDPSTLDCTVPACGDLVQDIGEECDANDGFCSTECTSIYCGNGELEPSNPNAESCDDGNNNDGDGCSSTCELEAFCGDGAVGPGEECDYNAATGDQSTPPQMGATCNASCLWEYCGNDILDPGEECDGEADCRDDCSIPECGDGDEYPALDPGETCDDGNLINGDGCNQFCLLEPACGNNQVEPGEECDNGGICSTAMTACSLSTDCPTGEMCMPISGDGCSDTCELEGCGNGVVEPSEECDPGVVSGPPCRLDCSAPRCGDGIFDPGEECDNDVVSQGQMPASGDGCDSQCDLETICGDGIRDDGEECDDGNLASGDGCSGDDGLPNVPTCVYEYCGNGYIDVNSSGTPKEQCDDDNNVSGDGCSSTCKLEPVCGDSVVQGSEQCDDGGKCRDSGATCAMPKWGQVDPCPGADICQPWDNPATTCGIDCREQAFCGDGKVTSPEKCDPNHPTNGQNCRGDCSGTLIPL